MKYIVYLTTNLINKKIYIGVHKTENPDVWDGYYGCGIISSSPSSYMNPSTPLQYAVKKYGCKNFLRKTLKVFDKAEDAYDLERFLVDPEFIKREDTYNACVGGLNGYRLNPVNQFDLNGHFLKTWDTVMDATEFYGISHTSVLNAIKYKGSCKDYYWSYDKNIDITEFTKKQNTPKCFVYDAKTLKYVNVFDSVTLASKTLGLTMPAIQQSILGKYKAGNYYFSNKLYDVYPIESKVNLRTTTIYIYNLNGDFIAEASGTKEICKFFNIKNTSSISKAIRINRPYKEYQISLEKVDKLQPVKSKANIAKKVGRYSKTGELLETFNSIQEAISKYNTSVQRCLRGQQQFCKGFIFKYIS